MRAMLEVSVALLPGDDVRILVPAVRPQEPGEVLVGLRREVAGKLQRQPLVARRPDTVPHDAYLLGTLGGLASAIVPGDYTTNNGPVLLDDAVGGSTIFVSSTQQIASLNVGFVVKHPRISDLTFTLISPTGQRVLLMENRGGTTTNGAGDFFITTNSFAPVTANGGGTPQTNYLDIGQTSGSLTINYDMFTVPDQMTVYYGTDPTNLNTNSSYCITNTGFINNPPIGGGGGGAQNTQPETFTVSFPPPGVQATSTYLTIVMNQFGNYTNPMTGLPDTNTLWTYTAGGVLTNFEYLAFTEQA